MIIKIFLGLLAINIIWLLIEVLNNQKELKSLKTMVILQSIAMIYLLYLVGKTLG